MLVVDDDQAVRDALDRALRVAGHHVTQAEHGLAALAQVRQQRPDVMVLDVSMPGADGLSVARRLRDDGDDLPILMLTARDAVDDRVAGLDAGADDYLVKPFSLEELLARLRALVRRTVRDDDGALDVLRFGELTLDAIAARVTRGGEVLRLSRTEFLLLELFLENPGIVFSREQILDRVWGMDAAATTNNVEVYVGYLRRKLGEPRVIQTVRGMGYVLRDED